MKKVVDELNKRTIGLVIKPALKREKDTGKSELWKKAIIMACTVTEGIGGGFADYILEALSTQRHFAWITSQKPLDDIYQSFILSIAVELCEFNAEKRFALSFGTAILDNWFELNNIDYRDIKNQIAVDKIVEIINDRERLYRKYFLLYDDELSKDIVRVYYPKNGESWIRWDKSYSAEVRINLSKGAEYGFCRPGFSYARVREQERETLLKVAYLYENREVLRFEQDNVYEIDVEKILWVW